MVAPSTAAARVGGAPVGGAQAGRSGYATDSVVKVLDFGVAAILDGDTNKLTMTGERIGTFQYMAPE